MTKQSKIALRWFEEYSCGCVSSYEKRKKDLLGYCGKHGNDRRFVIRVWVSSDELEADATLAATGADGD